MHDAGCPLRERDARSSDPNVLPADGVLTIDESVSVKGLKRDERAQAKSQMLARAQRTIDVITWIASGENYAQHRGAYSGPAIPRGSTIEVLEGPATSIVRDAEQRQSIRCRAVVKVTPPQVEATRPGRILDDGSKEGEAEMEEHLVEATALDVLPRLGSWTTNDERHVVGFIDLPDGQTDPRLALFELRSRTDAMFVVDLLRRTGAHPMPVVVEKLRELRVAPEIVDETKGGSR